MNNQQTATVTLTVDIVISRLSSTALEVLLIKRRKQPYQGMWALPGGKLNADDPSLEAAALREAREETGIELPAHLLKQVRSFGERERDPRGRFISALYTLSEPLGEDVQALAGDDACEARWFPALVNRPALAFDHEQLLDLAILTLFEWGRNNHKNIQRLETQRQCTVGSDFAERCPLLAAWLVNGWPICDEDIRLMANMNSDNEDLLRPALETMQRPWF